MASRVVKLPGRMTRVASLLALAALTVLVLAGCSRHHESPEPEGQTVKVHDLSYTVYITRQLNLRDPEDRDYFRGPEAPPGFAYYGVFIQVCNDFNHAPQRVPVSNFKVVDTEGKEFRPTPLPPTDVFAYRPEKLGAKQCVPIAGSAPATGPIGGSLLLFKLPISAIQNRPLDLEIDPPVAGETPESQKVELDI
jgi:hypothetical protein